MPARTRPAMDVEVVKCLVAHEGVNTPYAMAFRFRPYLSAALPDGAEEHLEPNPAMKRTSMACGHAY